MSDPVKTLVELASRKRLVKLRYKKPGEKAGSWRWVEPYKFIDGDVLQVRCYQVRSDDPDTLPGYRSFRTDRILSAEDGGEGFNPRGKITLADGVAHKPRRRKRKKVEALESLDWLDQYDGRTIEGQLAAAISVTCDDPTRDRAYMRLIVRSVLDDEMSAFTIREGRKIAEYMDVARRRSIHAAAYTTVITELIIDGMITRDEMKYLAKVRTFLRGLGWTP